MSHPASYETDVSHCPICGSGNGCAMAQGNAAADCWCMHTPIAAAQLARIAPNERGQRCLCQTCAQTPSQPASRN